VFASLILSESLDQTQIIFIFALIVGLFLTSYRGHISNKKLLLEKGLVIAELHPSFVGVYSYARNEWATEWFQKYHPYLGTTPINYVKKYGTEKLFLKLWKEKIHER
jgi:hypothetical protein